MRLFHLIPASILALSCALCDGQAAYSPSGTFDTVSLTGSPGFAAFIILLPSAST